MKALDTFQWPGLDLQPVEGASGTHVGERLLEDGRFHYMLPYVGEHVRALRILILILRPKRSVTRPRKSYKIRIGKRSKREMSKRSRITEGNWHPYIRSDRYVPVTYRYQVSRSGQGTRGTSAEGRGLHRGARTGGAETKDKTRGVKEDTACQQLTKRHGIDSLDEAYRSPVGKFQYGDVAELKEMVGRRPFGQSFYWGWYHANL